MRKFMVVMDDSSEFLNALYFAAMRAENTGAGVVILGVVGPEEFQHWLGVGSAMREEAEERIREHYKVFRKWMEGKVHIEPELIVRHGKNRADEIIAAVNEDPAIGVLVLGSGSSKKGPAPLVKELVSKRGGDLRVPLTLVPGHLTREELKSVS